jgi:CRISPR-associated protein (TIGR03986 family)
MAFVNPYTFVPLPEGAPEHGKPHGHDGTTPDLLTARLRVRITAASPLLIRGFGTERNPAPPTRPHPDRAGRIGMIPGSGLHGAVRSLHETLTDSCLRVLDTQFVPAYRQLVLGDEIAELRLAVVTEAPPAPPGSPPDAEPPPPTVRLCEQPRDPQTYRLRMNDLVRWHQELPDGLVSGARMKVTVNRGRKPDGRPATQLDAAPDPDGEWIVFLADAGARKQEHPYRAAARKLTGEHRTIPGPVWTRYREIVETADDMRTARLQQHPIEKRTVPIVFEYKPDGARTATPRIVGMRWLARPTLEVGQPVWVRIRNGEITELRLSQVWRKRGAGPVAERVGAFAPCSHHEQLCFSCRLFGSADVTGAQPGATEQRSYRGHVRFSDALAAEGVEAVEVMLPAMGAPKPGAGQAYLVNPAEIERNGHPSVPLREWGAAPGAGQRRRIRGRKFYWHTPQDGVPERGRFREVPDPEEPPVRAMIFPTGSSFTAAIIAVDVDAEQLGSLLAALDPAPVVGAQDALVGIGGGKPLGYGSCRITLDEQNSRVWVSAQRYRTGEPTPAAELLDRARAAFAARAARHAVTWTALAAALSPATVAGETVWYPPGPVTGTPDPGFEFWKQTNGTELAEDHGRRMGYPLTSLPLVTARDRRQESVRQATHRELRGKAAR